MLKLDLSNEAMRFIETLPGKQYKQVVGAMISLLKEPAPHDSRALVETHQHGSEEKIILRIS